MSEPNYSADEHLKSEANQYEFDFDPEAMKHFQQMQQAAKEGKNAASPKLGKYFGGLILLLFLVGLAFWWSKENQTVASISIEEKIQAAPNKGTGKNIVEKVDAPAIASAPQQRSLKKESLEPSYAKDKPKTEASEMPQKNEAEPEEATIEAIAKNERSKIPIKLEVVRDIKTMEEGERILLNNIQFEAGSPVMIPESKKEVQLLLQKMQENPSLEIEISGHLCCAVEIREGDGYDYDHLTWDLSQNRAKKVYEFLVKKGVEKSRLTYKGMGLEKPLVFPEKNEADEALNRRVEVKIIKQ